MNAAQRRHWRLYVMGCPELTQAQRIVLLALETFADYPTGTNARPGVSNLTEICGLKDSAVEKSLARGRELKLIHQTGRANPRRHLAAVYQLVPAPPSTRTGVRIKPDSTRTAIRVEPDFNPYGTEVLPVRNDVSTRTYVQPTNPLTPIGFTEGAGDAVAAPPPEPSRYCQRHPEGTTSNCGPCGTARKENEAWKAEQAGHLKAAGDQRRQAIADCPLCDEKGWLLDDDGLPNDDGIKCTHKETP